MWEFYTWKPTSIRRYYLCQIKKKKFKTCFSLLTFQSLRAVWRVKSGQKYHDIVHFRFLLQRVYDEKKATPTKNPKKPQNSALVTAYCTEIDLLNLSLTRNKVQFSSIWSEFVYKIIFIFRFQVSTNLFYNVHKHEIKPKLHCPKNNLISPYTNRA